jgi:hypothetical protein
MASFNKTEYINNNFEAFVEEEDYESLYDAEMVRRRLRQLSNAIQVSTNVKEEKDEKDEEEDPSLMQSIEQRRQLLDKEIQDVKEKGQRLKQLQDTGSNMSASLFNADVLRRTLGRVESNIELNWDCFEVESYVRNRRDAHLCNLGSLADYYMNKVNDPEYEFWLQFEIREYESGNHEDVFNVKKYEEITRWINEKKSDIIYTNDILNNYYQHFCTDDAEEEEKDDADYVETDDEEYEAPDADDRLQDEIEARADEERDDR